MNPIVGVSFAWVVVEVAIGTWFVLLGGVRRAGAEMLMFGLLAWLSALYGASTTLQSVTHGSLIALWEFFRTASGTMIIALAFDIALRFSGRRVGTDRVLTAVYGYCLLVTVLAAGHWLFEPVRIIHAVSMPLGALHYEEAPLNTVGKVVLAPVSALLIATTYVFVESAWRARRGQWGMTVAWFCYIAAVVNDALAGIAHWGVPYLLEHAGFIFVFTGSYTLLAQMTERLRSSRADLLRTEETLRSVRNTLAEKEHLAAVGELSAIVAHEIRNPLSAISNAVSTLRRSEVAPASKVLLLDIVNEECDRMNRIVTDLLTLARPINLQRQATDLGELVLRSLGPARREGTEIDVRVVPGAERPLYVDSHLLRQALENVVDNAVQAMGGGGSLTIVVTLSSRDGTEGREISVIDAGEGMNTEVRANARKAFFTTRESGTGLGLAIVDRIVTAHQGVVEIDSRKGEGTTVKMFLPEVRASDPGEAATIRPAAPGLAESIRPPGVAAGVKR